jgi:hypothetical protein
MATAQDLTDAADAAFAAADRATDRALVFVVGAMAKMVLAAHPGALWLELTNDSEDDRAICLGDVIGPQGRVLASGSDAGLFDVDALSRELDKHYRGWTGYLRLTAEGTDAMRWLDLRRASEIDT